MHWLELKPQLKLPEQRQEYLAKLPLLPYKYLYHQKGYTLALFKAEGDEPAYYLKTDNRHFFDSFLKYYRQRFEVTEYEMGITPDGPMVLVTGGECQSVEEPEAEAGPRTQK